MGFMDKAKEKAKDLLGDEEKTDAGLDRAQQAATDRLSEGQSENLGNARDLADERMGDQGAEQAEPPATENVDPADEPRPHMDPDAGR